MPHVDIKYKADIVSGELLNTLSGEITEIVGRYFCENPNYVSLEVLPQTEWTLNRKDVDIEVNSNPDKDGLRSKEAKNLADELGDFLMEFLSKKNIKCEISAWVRIFTVGEYVFKPPIS